MVVSSSRVATWRAASSLDFKKNRLGVGRVDDIYHHMPDALDQLFRILPSAIRRPTIDDSHPVGQKLDLVNVV